MTSCPSPQDEGKIQSLNFHYYSDFLYTDDHGTMEDRSIQVKVNNYLKFSKEPLLKISSPEINLFQLDYCQVRLHFT